MNRLGYPALAPVPGPAYRLGAPALAGGLPGAVVLMARHREPVLQAEQMSGSDDHFVAGGVNLHRPFQGGSPSGVPEDPPW